MGEAPAELRELTGAFNAMLDRLEDGVKRLSGFAADLAHDLRTPVNALMVKTQVALSRPRSADDYRALLESNIDEYERLARLIESTLFLARADNAQLAVRIEPVNVRATLDKVAEYFSGVAEEAGVRCQSRVRRQCSGQDAGGTRGEQSRFERHPLYRAGETVPIRSACTPTWWRSRSESRARHTSGPDSLCVRPVFPRRRRANGGAAVRRGSDSPSFARS